MSTWPVTVEPAGLVFDAPAHVPLVTAAQRQGVHLPRSCRNGTCRTCMCRLVQGEIRYRIEWPGLSADEKAEGWILPCVAHACSALVLQVPEARREPPTAVDGA